MRGGHLPFSVRDGSRAVRDKSFFGFALAGGPVDEGLELWREEAVERKRAGAEDEAWRDLPSHFGK